ncbi:16S rRNA (guanine(527)-N(7))-methyltransferase RsmG [Gordonia sp. PDNC005]|uniref:16S rRNA (guanine(527)-N(7))-methyltransferase RsmG n=1 Tax=unclassified Gordonia (in: high G+C Gram-positive bacteria) TaxID=2657482 RepID=UPI001966A7A6|nr:16S rRNA (guanine(527)-N(7))-methyltransferase RsmG [Gordonia sp. PDNC005]QRY62330.1 16S rRNA (guanine(527)-N(7))-methyltransferase RsmG [Gordonia sp. PDNC005]
MTDEQAAIECEPTPASAAEVFGDRLELAESYARMLTDEGVLRGLIGPSEVSRLWTRHILNCGVLGEVIDDGSTVFDIGSGAGLPGIPLAIAKRHVSITLIEPLLRRTTFLDEVVAELGLDNVTVIRGRAEEKAIVATVGTADIVTSRAVAPLARLAGWSAPLIKVGGRLVALKGRSVADEIERDRDAVRKAGLADLTVSQCGVDVLDEPTTLLTGTRVELASDVAAARRAARRAKRKR